MEHIFAVFVGELRVNCYNPEASNSYTTEETKEFREKMSPVHIVNTSQIFTTFSIMSPVVFTVWTVTRVNRFLGYTYCANCY